MKQFMDENFLLSTLTAQHLCFYTQSTKEKNNGIKNSSITKRQ